MRPNATIICHSRLTGLGAAPQITYEWQGGDVLEISCLLLSDAYDGVFSTRDPQPNETFWMGPFLLRCIEVRSWADSIMACRERPIKARALYALYRATRLLDLAYRRAILTLAVWGLATYWQGRVPTWRDIKGLGWLVQWDLRRRDKAMVDRVKRLNDSFKGE